MFSAYDQPVPLHPQPIMVDCWLSDQCPQGVVCIDEETNSGIKDPDIFRNKRYIYLNIFYLYFTLSFQSTQFY